jgi:hypothetical protein
MIAPEDLYSEKCCVDRDRLKTTCETSKEIRIDPAARLAAGPAIDRRARYRYPLSMTFTYRSLRSGEAGAGRTLNMSSKGLCCSGLKPLPTGTRLELCLDWPVLLEGVCPLKMLILGRIVHNDQRAVGSCDRSLRISHSGNGHRPPRGFRECCPLKKLIRGPAPSMVSVPAANHRLRCPRCGSTSIRRRSRRRMLDHLLLLIGRFPFRCYGCGHEFYLPHRGIGHKRIRG